jgi:hypothetical protein
MTVSTTDCRFAYSGDGVTTAFSFPRKVISASDITVYLVDETTDTSTLQTNPANYTFMGSGLSNGIYATATITFVTAPTSDQQVVIFRDGDLVQEVDFESETDVQAALNRFADRDEMKLQRLSDQIARSLRMDDGDPEATMPALPHKALLASKILGFDTDGNPEPVENNGSSNAVTAAGSTTARTLADRFGDVVNVLDFGAVGNGVTDDTTAINAANTFAVAEARALYFPGGYTFLYTGNGLTGSAMRLLGDGISQSVIVLGAGKYLVNDSALWGSFYMSGLRIVDGAGAVRSTYTSTMVQLTFQINDCYFYGYTGPCISNNSSDNPHWHIENCIFWGGDDTTCVGIALKGLTDSNFIAHNTFRKNKVCIKLGDGGNNAYVDFNDFVQYDGGTGRVAIHVVPDADGTNAGTGLVVGKSNKFGNENIDSSDFRIVYADELSGTYFGDKLPDTSTNSTGYIRGHNIGGAFIGGGSSPQQPLIKSMTKRVFGCSYTNIAIGGTPPTYILEFSQTPDALGASDPEWNLIGPVVFDGFEADDLAGFAACSSYNSVKVFDPSGSSTWKTKQPIVIEKPDDGAVGAALWLYHNSASPAASDIAGLLVVRGNDSAGNVMNYGDVRLYIDDPTDGSEDSQWQISTIVGGAYAARLVVQNGIYYAGGSDPGAGKFNGLAFHVEGTQVVGAQGAAVSDALTGGSATAADCATQLNLILARLRAHGLIAA